MEPLVVVITVNFNQNEYTLACVDSILRSEYSNFKVLLVDNGSSSLNVKSLENKLPVSDKLFFEKIENNIGYARGTNHGLKTGATFNPDFFLIMNNDTILDKYAIKELVNTCIYFEKKVIVTGKVYHYDEPCKLQIVGYKHKSKKLLTYIQLGKNEKDKGQYDQIEERDMIDDIFVLHPIEIFRKIGGYSPYLWVNGVNIDMGLRVKELGYRLMYSPKAKIWHKGSISIGGRDLNPKLAYWNIQSSLIIRYIHLKRFYFTFFYLITLNSIIRTKLKSKIYVRMNLKKYANAKIHGLRYFHKWVRKKNIDNGVLPF